MSNEKKHMLMSQLKEAFVSGYSNAATSFSTMTKDKILFHNFHHNFHRLDSDFFQNQMSFSRNGGNYLITTDIFGDINGKSYLFLSDIEFEILTASIGISTMKEELVKEMDNILSASVITHLSNQLKLKMYGDVPMMIGKVKGKIEDFILDDFTELSEEVYINSIYFTFENQPKVTPFFIWVIDNRLEKIYETRITSS